MRKAYVVLMCSVFFAIALGSYGVPLYYFTFDNMTTTTAIAGDTQYTTGPAEIVQLGDTVYTVANGAGADGPGFKATVSVGAADPDGIIQGGMAMVTESGGKDEGLEVRMNAAQPPGDLTVEFIFCTTTTETLTGNTADLQYCGSTEWPSGGNFQWMLRYHGPAVGPPGAGHLFFWTDKGDSNQQKVGTINPIAPLTWYHAACVLDYNAGDAANSQIRFYLDGALQGTNVYDASTNIWSLGCSSSPPPHTNIWTMGFHSSLWANLGDHRGLDGAIDAVAISGAALYPSAFVLHPYAAPSGVRNWSMY
jgi:hypothetical protein